jgi:hypothetical protein
MEISKYDLFYKNQNDLDQIYDRTIIDEDLRIDLERSFYLFIKAV